MFTSLLKFARREPGATQNILQETAEVLTARAADKEGSDFAISAMNLAIAIEREFPQSPVATLLAQLADETILDINSRSRN